MTLYELKPRFQAWLRPVVQDLAHRGATANQVTVAAAAGSLAVGVLAAIGMLVTESPALFLLFPFWLFLRMALNAIDGMLAREHGQQSALGAYLNELGDIVSDLALILPLAALPDFGLAQVGTFALLAVMAEAAGLAGPLAGASRRYDGPLGKSDRAFAVGAIALWAGLGLGFGGAASWLWLALSLLSLYTIANRVRRGVAEARARTAG
ncbi:CDP-alcohol phosphatidyltransferase family protein [Cupriavidus consociatus]|uniref:CDP-alcohol phosphatidyltransferase family protein n=1 Tax=Cupriavidus consociatus TaxID=2821357 RepID=UPI001AE7B3D9|nr:MULTISPECIES: CDP-alcohol phosphatidyltransferase family protein [unclassified Cupriavidus]MBP0618698.1 CDP-alcohol phosphatidyltransferase family protein [Cupriavidus sp. LEh25]MDK2655338.1 CDP-alcohol phosphatidyltransferase family protein [Cupriavidus sp. LEh21]